MRKQVWYLLFFGIMSITIFLGYIIATKYFATRTDDLQAATVFNMSTPLQDFNLRDYDGAVFNARRLRARESWTLLFFGYMRCPDVCPTTLSLMRDVWQANAKLSAAGVRFIFAEISGSELDLAQFKQFIQGYREDFIGIYGSKEDVKQLSRQFGVYYNESDERIDHSGQIFLLDPRGRLVASFGPLSNVDALVHDLNKLLII